VAFSPDGLTLASGGGETYRNGELRLWDVRRGKELASFLSLQGDVVSVAFSPDGLTLATSIFNKYGDDLRLWDLRTGQQLGSLTNPYDHVDSVAFSPDGRTLASIVINYSRINFSIRNPYRLRLYFAATHEEVARQRDN
jgi:WD40 repeat protein